MRILFCKWNGCAEIGMESAMKRLGHTVDSVQYAFEGADYSEECVNLLQTQLEQNRYEMVFSQNFIPIVSKVCNIFRVKYISWVMDSPAYHLYAQTLKSPYNYVFIFDRMLYERFVHVNPEHIFYYPLATCMKEWENAKKQTPKRNFSADVSFLGSMYVTESVYDSVKDVPEYIHGYMEGLLEAQLNVYGYNFLEDALPIEIAMQYAEYADWRQTEDYVRDVKGVVSQVYLGKKCAQMERFRIAETLMDSEIDFKLYTNSPLTGKLQTVNQGVVGYYDEMPHVFAQSKINLNITSKSICSGLPLRMFDIMGCGGFLLTNYQSELAEYFEIGKELAVYESIPHLLEQVRYYVDHEDERREIAKRGYEKVKQHFSYDVALPELFYIAGLR